MIYLFLTENYKIQLIQLTKEYADEVMTNIYTYARILNTVKMDFI